MVNGQYQDTLADPMELTVAKDGRVFYAERAGVVKMWSPQTKQITSSSGRFPVFTGLEDGLLRNHPGPQFSQKRMDLPQSFDPRDRGGLERAKDRGQPDFPLHVPGRRDRPELGEGPF